MHYDQAATQSFSKEESLWGEAMDAELTPSGMRLPCHTLTRADHLCTVEFEEPEVLLRVPAHVCATVFLHLWSLGELAPATVAHLVVDNLRLRRARRLDR